MNWDDVEPLTIAQAMKMTGRSKRTIDRWIKDGRLHAVDLGGFESIVVDRAEVAKVEKEMRDNQATTRAVEGSKSAT
jgi:excisionase family DNA binding protein